MKRITFIREKSISVTILLVLMISVSCHKSEKSYTYETTVAKKGSIINTITATGTIQADTTVSIGTQVSGVVKRIYVDFNSNVKKGQLLAELDKTPLETQVQQAERLPSKIQKAKWSSRQQPMKGIRLCLIRNL